MSIRLQRLGWLNLYVAETVFNAPILVREVRENAGSRQQRRAIFGIGLLDFGYSRLERFRICVIVVLIILTAANPVNGADVLNKYQLRPRFVCERCVKLRPIFSRPFSHRHVERNVANVSLQAILC